MAWRCSSVAECLPSMCKALGPSGALLRTTQTHIWPISNTSLSKARFQAEVQGIATGGTLFSFFFHIISLSLIQQWPNQLEKNGCYINSEKHEFFSFLLLDIGIGPRQGLDHARYSQYCHVIYSYIPSPFDCRITSFGFLLGL